jgi:demethylmenaquinone methyltransferase/2-methoxy-6-polyprenyl-1,4-benzoquinol methylase
MPILDHFGILAPYYDRALPLNLSGSLINLINFPINGALLDAGGGTGRVAEALKPYISPIYVVDLSVKMLNQARMKNGLQLVNSPTERLPFPNNTFERVIMVDAFHHVFDQRLTADELWRVLKPGGRLIIEEPDIRNFSVKLIAVAEKMALMRSHFLDPNEIASLFPKSRSQMKIHCEGFNTWVMIEKTV